mmetsp:Transcript_33468/g.93916  ORF Transcript_33468/g.93916 Transcript_33468/m.93916 type:complete len:180 (+) Transcript_33468:90-629(+)
MAMAMGDIRSDETTFLVAIMSNSSEDAEKLMADDNFVGINALDRHSRSALHLAVAHKMERVCQEILRRADFMHVNARDQCDRTALHLAAIYGLGSIVKAILVAPSFDEVNAKDGTTGQTALIWASKCGHKSVVDALLKCGQIDVNETDKNGNDAHTIARKYGHDTIANLIALHPKWLGN